MGINGSITEPIFTLSNYSYTLYDISKSPLYEISWSPADYNVKISQHMDIVEFTKISPYIVTLNRYGRTTANNHTQYNLSLSGNWTYSVSSKRSSSCIVFYSIA